MSCEPILPDIENETCVHFAEGFYFAYDRNTQTAYVHFIGDTKRAVCRTIEIVKDEVLLDVDDEGHPIGIEILNVEQDKFYLLQLINPTKLARN